MVLFAMQEHFLHVADVTRLNCKDFWSLTAGF